MPALWVTIDNMDGTTTVKGPVWPDDIPLQGLLMKLSENKIAGVTFTRANPLTHVMEHGDEPRDDGRAVQPVSPGQNGAGRPTVGAPVKI